MNAIEFAIEEHKPIKVFALMSGGNDSLVSTHEAMESGKAQEVIHIRTGIGVPETTDFVIETCKVRHWPLRVLEPPDLTYEQFVLREGFPGPGAHRYAYVWLKERALVKLVRETKRYWKDRIAFVTGVRMQESARRMGYVQPVIRVGATVWVANKFSTSKDDLRTYIQVNGLAQNPVVEKLGFSGECLCGAFAEPGEMKYKIEPNFPGVARQIHDLEARAESVGVHCKWGTRPPRDRFSGVLPFQPLCAGCNFRI